MTARHKQTPWSRVIILVDMNCFFAQIEQQDNRFWRNRPVAVTNGKLGSTIITASYEARAYGVKTGMRLKEAREHCPELLQAPSRPERYAAVSSKIMAALYDITPDVEVYSVDEAFLDVTNCQSLHGTPAHIGKLVKEAVSRASGLTCSVGVSGDKTTAKFAAKLHKPDGLTVIPPWESEARLAAEPVTELSGISHGIGNFLAQYGVHKCGDMKRIPMSLVAQRFGNPGRRLWLMAQGKDPEEVITEVKDPKTIGHGKVLPPGTRDVAMLLIYFQHMAEKVGARLRRHEFQSDRFFIGLKQDKGWLAVKPRLSSRTDDGLVIFELCKRFLKECFDGKVARQVQITAVEPRHGSQPDLFAETEMTEKRTQLNHALDEINGKFGDFTVAPMRVIGRSEMPNVIAPAWKPTGHRKTI